MAENRRKRAEFRHALCVYPYRAELGPRARFYPPLGLEIIAAVLRPYCRSIDVVDLRHETKRTRDFLRPETDLVCFSVNWDCERGFIAEEVRSVPGSVRTIVGGRCATIDPGWWLSECPNIDILVRGDGEDTMKEIVEGLPLERIEGISYRLNAHVVHNKVRDCGPVPDDYAPDRSLRRYTYSLDSPRLRSGLTFDTIASSLGCPFNCKFCAVNLNPWGKKRGWSARSPEAVVGELEQTEAEVVAFVDPNFAHDPDRVEAICDLIIERGIRKKYIAEARLEIARRPDVLGKMEQAGFAVLAFGVESAQDKTLRSMQKGFDTRRARGYFEVLRRTGIILHGHFIVGSIGETEQEMLEIVPFARELGVDTITANLLTYYPYTGLDELIAQSPGYYIGPDERIYSDQYPPERLRGIRDRIVQEFYRPRRLIRILRKAYRHGLLTRQFLRSLPKLFLYAVRGRFNPEAGRDPDTVEAEAREFQNAGV